MIIVYQFPICMGHWEEYEYEASPCEIKEFLEAWVQRHGFEDYNKILKEGDRLGCEAWKEMEVEEIAKYLYDRNAHQELQDEIRDFFEDDAREEFKYGIDM